MRPGGIPVPAPPRNSAQVAAPSPETAGVRRLGVTGTARRRLFFRFHRQTRSEPDAAERPAQLRSRLEPLLRAREATSHPHPASIYGWTRPSPPRNLSLFARSEGRNARIPECVADPNSSV